jgi:hypothetical protein
VSVAGSLELLSSETVWRRIKDRLPSYRADLRENPRWLVMFLLARTSAGRAIGHLRAQSPAAPNARCGPSMFAVDRGRVVAALRSDGLFDRLRLPDDVTARIQDFAERTGCFGNHDRRLDLLPAEHMARQSATHPVTSGHYFERVHGCPAIAAVADDPLLHCIARDYLGPAARLISTRLWWSFPVPLAAGAAGGGSREMLHFDLDDWRIMKCMFYLTPVDDDAGPHLYVRRSHRRHSIRHQFSLTVGRPLDDVLATYGADRLVRVHGPAGSGLVEDSFGFHAGSLARRRPRLMLEVGFGITPPGRRRFFGERVVAARADRGAA